MPTPLRFPKPAEIRITENHAYRTQDAREREWFGSLMAGMTWLSSVYADTQFVFRGHPDASWHLTSSLWRHARANSREELRDAEDEMLASVARDFWFVREFGFTPQSDSESFYTLAVLQHHGIPTSLLDVTADPLVALYFAVIGCNDIDDRDDVDGAVYFIRRPKVGEDASYTVVPAPQISPRVSAQRSMFLTAESEPDPIPKGARKGMRPRVCIDYAEIDPIGRSDAGDFSEFVEVFLNGGKAGRPIPRPPNIVRFRIPSKMKPVCRETLLTFGVSAALLFPGSEGFAKALRRF